MIFICWFLILAVIVTVALLLAAMSTIVLSGDKPITGPPKFQQRVKSTPESQKKAYIDLNGRLIELENKAEETKAKKDGYKVVYR